MSPVVGRLCRHVVDDVTKALFRTSEERVRDVTGEVKHMAPVHLQFFSDQWRCGVPSWNRHSWDEYRLLVLTRQTVDSDILTKSRFKAESWEKEASKRNSD